MEYQYGTVFFDKVRDFIKTLPKADGEKIAAAISVMRSAKFESIFIKQLRNQIKELKVRKYRLIFFIHANNIYFVGAFVKKSKKTPAREIDTAEKVYKEFKNKIS